jgi:hypothetical protein
MVFISMAWLLYGLAISMIRHRYAIPIAYLSGLTYFSIAMARQKGLIKITGTLDDVNFYVSNGVAYARKAGGGFNGDAIKNNRSMQRVRENGSEFGHCSRVKKQFRLALLPFLKDLKGKALHSNMTQLFLAIKALDAVSERGQRNVAQGLQTAKGKRLLRQFEFTPQSSLLNALYSQTSFDWASQSLHISDFNPRDFKAPKAATHVGVTLGVLDFDFETLASSFKVSTAYFLPVGAGATSFDLQPNAVITPEYVGIAIFGVRYYEVIDTEVYGLDTCVGVRVLECLY